MFHEATQEVTLEVTRASSPRLHQDKTVSDLQWDQQQQNPADKMA